MLSAKMRLYAAMLFAIAVLGTAVGAFALRSQAGEAAAAAANRGETQLLQMQLEAAQKELVQVYSELRKAQVDLALARKKEKSEALPVSEDAVSELIHDDAVAGNKRREIAALKTQIDRIAMTYVESAATPRIRQMKDRIASLDKEIAKRANEIRPVFVNRLREAARREAAKAAEKQVERIEYLKELEKVVAADVLRLSAQVITQPESLDQRVANLEREVRELKARVRGLVEKK
jgi:hypothetical protein